MLDAEDIQRKRWRACGHDAVLADDAVLFAAAHKFAREQQQRPLAAVEQHELVHGSPGWLGNVDWTAIPSAHHLFRAALPHHDFPGRQAFFQSQKGAGVLAKRSDHGKYGNIFVGCGI